MPPRSSPSITSTTKRAKCLSGSHSSTDGGRRNAVRRSTSRKLLIAIKPPFGANQWRDSSENQRRWVKSDRLLEDATLTPMNKFRMSLERATRLRPSRGALDSHVSQIRIGGANTSQIVLLPYSEGLG